MSQTPNLEKEFPKEYEKLVNLFGSNEVRSKAGRLNEIYAQCEAAWNRNLDRLRNIDVKYLLIAEAPPWSEGEVTRYFYRTFDQNDRGRPIQWIRGLWKVFYSCSPPNDIEESLRMLAKSRFLLIDSLPFSMKYSSYYRNKPLYSELVKSCSGYLIEKLNNKKIRWSKSVKLALAFKLNGKAIINAFPDGIDLPNDQTIKLSPSLIAAGGNNFPDSQKLKDIWCLESNVQKRKPNQTEWEKVANKAMEKLMDAGVPYHKGIIGLIKDLEFHYQTDQGEILSSVEQANLYINTDVRIHSQAVNLNYEAGKQVFYYWAAIFHPEDYIKIMAEKISNELEKSIKKRGGTGSPKLH
jgi:hypothetical protein